MSCLAFRQGSAEIFSGSFDRTVKIWNADDRKYITTLFGHQSEVLGIDCLRKERVLTVGRDRTMQLFKVLIDYLLMILLRVYMLNHLPINWKYILLINEISKFPTSGSEVAFLT